MKKMLLFSMFIFILSGCGKEKKIDFSDVYNTYCGSEYASVGEDGSYLKIDTNPTNEENYAILEAMYAIEDVNKALGLPDSVYEKMGDTRALDGRVEEKYEDIIVSWSYHPNSGLEVLYEVNRQK